MLGAGAAKNWPIAVETASCASKLVAFFYDTSGLQRAPVWRRCGAPSLIGYRNAAIPVVVEVPRSALSLWTLQSAENRARIIAEAAAALSAARGGVEAILTAPHFQRLYSQRLRQIISDAAQSAAAQTLAPESAALLSRAAAESFDGPFLEGLAGQLVTEIAGGLFDGRGSRRSLLERSVEAVLAREEVRTAVIVRIQKFAETPEAQEAALAFVRAALQRALEHPRMTALLGEVLNDPAFDDALSEALAEAGGRLRRAVELALQVSAAGPSIHPIAAELLASLTFDRPRQILLLLPEPIWRGIPRAERQRLTPVAFEHRKDEL